MTSHPIKMGWCPPEPGSAIGPFGNFNALASSLLAATSIGRPAVGAALASRLARPLAGRSITPSISLLPMAPALMIPLLTAAGLAGFWLFYKSIDFFDNI